MSQGQGFQRRKHAVVYCVICLVIGLIAGVMVDRTVTGGLGSSESGKFSVLHSVYRIMTEDWYFGKDQADLGNEILDAAAKGMVDAGGDPHTQYMTEEEISDFYSSLDNSMVGIGISYTLLGGKIQVRDVLNGTPAESYGLQTGDYIIAVDGESTQGHTVDELSSMITGEEGTKVTVTVERGTETFDLTIVRAKFYTTVTYEMVDDTTGYLVLSSFSSGTEEEVKTALDALKDAGAKRLVIDVRDDGGGYLDTLQKISSYFMDSGQTILYEKYRDGSQEEITADGSLTYQFDKIVLIVNENSASCTEIFAESMRQNAGAVLVGTTTYGKGTVQTVASFPDGSALKYTQAEWLTPSGESINGVGVKPDVEVELDEAMGALATDLPEGESYALDSVSEYTASAQKFLKFLGYEVDRTDGYFSAETDAALRQFQADDGFEADGVLDQEMNEQLISQVLREWDLHPEIHDAQYIKAMEVVHE